MGGPRASRLDLAHQVIDRRCTCFASGKLSAGLARVGDDPLPTPLGESSPNHID